MGLVRLDLNLFSFKIHVLKCKGTPNNHSSYINVSVVRLCVKLPLPPAFFPLRLRFCPHNCVLAHETLIWGGDRKVINAV